jgi:hypothetical protein
MLVDLARNDLGRVCEFGSVRVREQMVVERYSHVMHIVSQVEGQFARSLMPLTWCGPPSRPERSAARRKSAPCRSSATWNAIRAARTPVWSVTLPDDGRWIPVSPSAPC